MKNEAIGVSVGTAYARCAYVSGRNAAPVMIPNRFGKIYTHSGGDVTPLLLALREDAEVFLGRLVSSCALAVPNSPEVFKKAAEAAGMTDASTVNEPEAAVLAWGAEGRVMVLDAGAGPAKISVVENEGGATRVLESAEGEQCGKNFDLSMSEWLRERLGLPCMTEDDPRRLALIHEAEAVKISLSSCMVYGWQPPALREGAFAPVRVEREELERLTRFTINRLVNAAAGLWDKYRPKRLLLTGGSSHIPLLRETVERRIAAPERTPFEPEDASAIGAALCAAGHGITDSARKSAEGSSNPQNLRRVSDLKTRLMRVEPSMSAPHKKRLRLMLDKLDVMADESQSMQTMEDIVQALENLFICYNQPQ